MNNGVLKSFAQLLVLGWLSVLMAGCETTHFLNLYSLGFTKRDAYIDNLSDARDTLSDLAAIISPVASTEATLEKKQRKKLNQADEALDTFRKQLKISYKIGNSWLQRWQTKPQKFKANGYTADQVVAEFDVLQKQALEIADQLHKQLKKPKAADAKALLQHIEAADSWADAVNQHVAWLETSESGYPVK